MPTQATPLTDPNVKIPAAVKAKAAAADALHNSVYAKVEVKDPVAAEGTPTDAPKEPVPPVKDPVEPVAPAAEVTPQVTEAPAAKDTNWEHAYKSMKGRHDRLQEANRSLVDQVANLETVIAGMQRTPPAAPTPPELRPEALISPQEVTDYGKEFLDVVGKKARETVGGDVAALSAQVAELNKRLQNVNQSQAVNARSKMKEILTSKIPNWSEVNLSDEFMNWLQLPDPFSGAIRHTLLKAAWERNETPRVLAFFKGFLDQEAALAPTDARPDQTQGDQPGKIPLETFAAPGRAKSAADTGSPAEKPIITRAFITDFYRDSAAGKYRGRDEEKARTEAMIIAATREGRIQ